MESSPGPIPVTNSDANQGDVVGWLVGGWSAEFVARGVDDRVDGVELYRLSLVSFPVYFWCERYNGSLQADTILRAPWRLVDLAPRCVGPTWPRFRLDIWFVTWMAGAIGLEAGERCVASDHQHPAAVFRSAPPSSAAPPQTPSLQTCARETPHEVALEAAEDEKRREAHEDDRGHRLCDLVGVGGRRDLVDAYGQRVH